MRFTSLWAPMGAVALAVAALAPAQAAETKSVAVTAIVEHPALDSVRDGVQDGDETKALRNRIPSRASRSKVGVRTTVSP